MVSCFCYLNGFDRIRRLATPEFLRTTTMRIKTIALASVLILTVAGARLAQTPEAPRYLLPPQEIVEAFDSPPLPTALLSPTKQLLALSYRRPYPTIADLSRPMLRLAGLRVNPRTNGPHRTGNIYAISFRKISDGAELKVSVPPQANISNIHFSPDGAHLSFLNTRENGIELWVADVATGKARMISGSD